MSCTLRSRWVFSALFVATASLSAALLFGCGGTSGTTVLETPSATTPQEHGRALTPTTHGIPFLPSGTLLREFSPYPYGDATRYFRYRDVLDRRFFRWGTDEYSADGTYDNWYETPEDPLFPLVKQSLAGGATLAGTITADGLKPYFAYQVKLEGQSTEPRLSARGKPRLYDLNDPINWANEQIGSLGRWWCNTCAAEEGGLPNVTDAQLNLHRGHVILGYMLFDFFVTDADGKVAGYTEGGTTVPGGIMNVNLDSSFHVLWKSPGVGQRAWTSADGPKRIYSVGEASCTVYAEQESGRPRPGTATLPDGAYACRLLLTEESFHNDPDNVVSWGVTEYPDGGFWVHALAEETLEFTIGAVQNESPVVTIASPADGATFQTGATISFVGSADDAEDGVLTADLQWTSSIDEAIGEGGAPPPAALSDGVHTITASVIDLDGAPGSASITITVGDPPPPNTMYVIIEPWSTTLVGDRFHIGYANVTVRDGPAETDSPVDGVSVTGKFTFEEALLSTATRTTDGTGLAFFQSKKTREAGAFTFEVLSVTKAGWVLDPNADLGPFDAPLR